MRGSTRARCAAALMLGGAIVGGAGPDGVLLDIVNRSGAALECHAIAGHWYGFDLGTLPLDGRAAIALGWDARTGTLSLPNSLGQAIPLQSIYCGRAHDAWRTRADISLRAVAAAGPTARVACRSSGGALICS